MDKNTLLSLVKNPEYKPVFGFLVNIFLVSHNARKAALLEYSELLSLGNELADIYMEKVLKICTQNGLVYLLEDQDIRRYLVSTPDNLPEYLMDESAADMKVGRILGFQCVDHDYSNLDVVRLAKNIIISFEGNEADIAEVCEQDKISRREMEDDMNTKIQRFSSVLPEGFVVRGTINILLPPYMRMDKLKSLDFVQQNLNAYIDDLDNYWGGKEIKQIFINSVQKPNIYKNLSKLYLSIWKIFVLNNAYLDLIRSGLSPLDTPKYLEQFDNIVANDIKKGKIPINTDRYLINRWRRFVENI